MKIRLVMLWVWVMLCKNQKQNTYDFSDLVEKLCWQGDAVVTQRQLRDEW